MRCPSALFANWKYDPVVFNVETNNDVTPNTTLINAWLGDSIGDEDNADTNPVIPDNTITGKSIAVRFADTICSASRCINPNVWERSPVLLKYNSNAVVQVTIPTVASLILIVCYHTNECPVLV